MAVVLEYSTDRGSSWTTLTGYTHPTDVGIHPIPVEIGGIFETTDVPIRFRIFGSDAANWGLFDWVVKAPTTIKRDRLNT